jgi:hypothetical protein
LRPKVLAVGWWWKVLEVGFNTKAVGTVVSAKALLLL